MDAKEKTNQLLLELTEATGISGATAALNENNVCVFQHAEKLQFVIELLEPISMLQMYCPIVDVPKQASADFYKRFLKSNLFCIETQGALFALDEANNRIILSYGIPLENLTAVRFIGLVGAFIQIAEKWFKEMNGDKPTPPQKSSFSNGTFPIRA